VLVRKDQRISRPARQSGLAQQQAQPQRESDSGRRATQDGPPGSALADSFFIDSFFIDSFFVDSSFPRSPSCAAADRAACGTDASAA
jgi:hypothetical protein